MANVLGRLVVRMVADTLQYKADLKTAAKDTVDAAKEIENGTQAATSKVGKLGEALDNASKVAGAASGDLAGAAQGAQVLAAGAGTATVAVGLMVAVVAGVGYAAYEADKELQAVQKSLILTGNSAGVTAGQVQMMARDISQSVGSQSESTAALTQLAATGRVAGGDLQKLGQVALESQKVLGVSVADTVKQFAELGAEPVRASLRLNETTGYLTVATFEQIKAAVALGDTERAASLAQNAAADAQAERTARVKGNLNFLQIAWMAVGEEASRAWEKMLNLGRQDGPEQQLEMQRQTVANLQALYAKGGLGAEQLLPKIEAAQRALGVIEATTEATQNQAKAEADNTAAQKAGIAAVEIITKANAGALTQQERNTAALKEYRAQLEALRRADPSSDLLIAATIEKTEQAILRTGQAAKRAGDEFAAQRTAAKAYADVFTDLTRIRDQATAKTEDLTKAEARYREYLESPAYKVHTQEIRDLVAARAQDATAAEKQEIASKKVRQGIEQATKAYLADIDARNKAADAVGQQVAKLQEEEKAAALAAEQNVSLALALQQVVIARLEDQKIGLLGNEAAVLAVQREIDKRRELLGVIRNKDAAKAAQDGLKEQVDGLNRVGAAGRKVFNDVSEHGVDGFKRIGATLKASVLDVLYQATLRPFVIQLAGSLTGASASAIAQATGAGAAGGLGGLGSLTGLGSISGAFGSSLRAGFSASIDGGFGILGTTLEGGLASIGTATSAGVASGLGQIAGALDPYAIAGAGLLAVYNYFKSKEGGPKTESGFGPLVPGVGDPAGARAISESITAGYNTVARELGIRAGDLQVGVLTAIDTRGKALTQLAVEAVLDGQTVSSRGARLGTNENVGRTTEALAAAVAAETNVVIFEALRRSNLAPEFAAYLNSYVETALDPETAINNLRRLAQTNALFAQFGLGISALAGYSLEAQQRLVGLAGGLEALTARLNSYRQNFYSQAERDAQTTADIARELATVGLTLPATRAEFRALVDANFALGEAGARTVNVLLGVEAAFAGLVPAAEAAVQATTEAARAAQEAIANAQASARSRTDAANNALERTIGRQRDAVQAEADLAQARLDSIRAVTEQLASSTRDLRGEVASTRAQDAQAGSRFIEQALAAAQATGALPDSAALTQAIGSVRANFDQGGATPFERERDRLVLAGQLSQLQTVSGTQLSEAERQVAQHEAELERLDGVLANERTQIDLLRGIDTRLLTEIEAIRELGAAIAAERAINNAAASSASAVAAGGGSSAAQAALAASNPAQFGVENLGYQFAGGTGGRTDRAYLDQLAQSAAINGYTDVAAYDRLINSATAADRAELLGQAGSYTQPVLTDYEQVLRAQNLANTPAFANGGQFGGGLRLVGERGPELEVTGPARYYNAQQTQSLLGGGDDAQLKGDNAALRKELALLQSAQLETNRMLGRLVGAAERGQRVPQKVAVV